ncbi:UNVERIFIED_CONTAM: protein FAF-like, chloroplastic [Sesamum radiatum]|uniref:Protein FAF-like, chloroplastic n=1 Tax=Sesamum radiatum TaxID=300843 RepID=A0AAW2UMX5_SESRA
MSPNRLIPSPPTVKVVDEELPMKQGIVTILGSDCERSKAKSIRRTLSADMSSKKWLQQNGFFSPVKKISCSSSSSSESEEEYEKIPGQDDVWRSIQAEKERNEGRKTAEISVWGSILTQKSESSCLPPPYVHPLVKRSASSLSEKSLEICTESLGSETGSDIFSSYSLSDGDEDKERERAVREECSKELNPFPGLHVAKYKKSPARPFPPPLPSIAGGDGASLHMQAHRENGRLVVEAVSVPPRNYFHAQRQDGRLVLTLIHATPSSKENRVQEFEKVFDNMEEVDEDVPPEEERFDDGDDGGLEDEYAEEEKFKEEEFMVEQNSRSLPNGMISVHKTGLVMKKLMAIGNKNPTWSKNFNQDDQVMTEDFPIPQSLPAPPRVARLIPPPSPPAAALFNVYEYFWRNKTSVSSGGSFITTPQSIHLKHKQVNTAAAAATKVAENQELVVTKGNKTEYFVPYIRGCKESRRSLLIWEPYCIATS